MIHKALSVSLEQEDLVIHKVWGDTAVTEDNNDLAHTLTLKVL